MTAVKRVLIITDEHPRFPGPAADAAQYLLIRELQRLGTWDVHLAVAIKSGQTGRLQDVAKICSLHQHVWDTDAAASNSIVYGPLRRVYHAMLRRPMLRSTAARVKGTYFSLSATPARVRSAQHPGFRNYVQDLVTGIKPDVVLIQHSYLADIGEALGDIPYVVCVYDLLTLHTARARALATSPSRRLALRIEQAKMHRYERAALGRAGAVVLMTADEQRAYQRMIGAGNEVVVPVGIDLEYFAPHPRGTDVPPAYDGVPVRLLYTGSFTYGPNLDALQYFARDIAPLLAARLPHARTFFVGPWAPAAEHIRAQYSHRSDIVVTGHVDDTRPYFGNADVVLVPLRLGTGIRVKILEAMSMERPVVSSSVGAEGIEAAIGEHIMIADTPSQFVDAIVTLVEDRAAAVRMAKAARSLVERRYSIDVMTIAIEAALSGVSR